MEPERVMASEIALTLALSEPSQRKQRRVGLATI
jgi:hypothetical protein